VSGNLQDFSQSGFPDKMVWQFQGLALLVPAKGGVARLTELVRCEAARRALTEAHSVKEVEGILDNAEAMAAEALQAGDREGYVDALELRLRAERRLGQLTIQARSSKDEWVAEAGVVSFQLSGNRALSAVNSK
jgi:hypothetical protein